MNRSHLLIAISALFIALGSLLPIAAAQGRNMEREHAIEQELAQINPALVEPFRQATQALDHNEPAKAEAFLRDVIDQAPNFDAGWRRLGAAVTAQGRIPEGSTLTEHALRLKRSSANLASMAYVLAFSTKPGQEAPERDRRDALELLRECQSLPDGDDSDILCMVAQLGFSLNVIDVAREAIRSLENKYPDLMATHYFAAVLAATEEHWIRAENEIHRAGELGLPDETVQRFLNSGIHSAAFRWRMIRATALTVVSWAGGLLALYLVGLALSRLTLAKIEKSDPRIGINKSERRLRKAYRTLINLAGVYYYLSLPIVLLLVIVGAGALVMGLFMIGVVPIYFTVMLIIGALVTVVSMVRSLFIRIKHEDPGEALAREDAPALWLLAEEVALALNTRPVDEIRITPGTDLCVYENGGWRQRMNDKARRVLVLGAAVLHDFKPNDFRSVLAHEYGHFAHRDTAGGDIALRVRNDIIKFYLALANHGLNRWSNVAFQFLRLYHFIFHRISHGATRLQEVLADRVAALTYGPTAFRGGLTHVIRQNILFHEHANREIEAAIKAQRPVQNLYAPLPDPLARQQDEITKELTRPTTDNDSHPGPQDRFKFIATLPEPAGDNFIHSTDTVWDLIAVRDNIVKRLTEQVEKNIARHRT